MKNITVINTRTFRKTVRVSDSVFIHLCPDLHKVCEQRDGFWRILLDIALPMGHDASHWWRMANELETLIENLSGDYSI
jgi:hypothetical protein